MTKTPVALAALALAAATALAPTLADARTHHHRHHHYAHRHYAHRHYAQRHYSDNGCRQRHARNGAIIGAVGGGIVANSMARGNRLPGTMLGAGVGALAGHAIGKSSGC